MLSWSTRVEFDQRPALIESLDRGLKLTLFRPQRRDLRAAEGREVTRKWPLRSNAGASALVAVKLDAPGRGKSSVTRIDAVQQLMRL